jgi:hypothetical protein
MTKSRSSVRTPRRPTSGIDVIPFPDDPLPSLPPAFLLAIIAAGRRVRTAAGKRRALPYVARARELLDASCAPAIQLDDDLLDDDLLDESAAFIPMQSLRGRHAS